MVAVKTDSDQPLQVKNTAGYSDPHSLPQSHRVKQKVNKVKGEQWPTRNKVKGEQWPTSNKVKGEQ